MAISCFLWLVVGPVSESNPCPCRRSTTYDLTVIGPPITPAAPSTAWNSGSCPTSWSHLGSGEVPAAGSASRRRRGEVREVIEERPRFEPRGEVLVHHHLDDVDAISSITPLPLATS